MRPKIQKKQKIIISIIIVAIIIPIFSLFLSSSQNTKIQPSPSLAPPIPTPSAIQRQTDIEQITVGSSTKNDIYRILGQPESSSSDGKFTTLSYTIHLTQRKNNIYLNNDQVQYILEEIPVDNTLLNDFTNQSGTKLDAKLADKNYSGAGFYWHIFSNKGIAFLANPTQGYTIRILRFIPTDYSTFLATIAPFFSITTIPTPSAEKLD